MSDLISKDQALNLLREAKNVLIAPSTPMDGDSLGTALAMMLVLRKLGKNVSVVSIEPTPDYLEFLPHVKEIQHELSRGRDFIITLDTEAADVDHMKYEVEQGKINIIITPKEGRFSARDVTMGGGSPDFDLIITVDTGDLVQLGSLYEDNKAMFEKGPLLNIDHHSSNSKFGTHNYLDYKVAATTQMVFPLLKQLEEEHGSPLIDEDVATLLLTGIVTDTGSFQHSNTTPEAFEVAAELLDHGARQQEIIKQIFKTKSLATLKLWGRVLSKIQYEDEHRLVYSTITQQDLSDTGAKANDSGGIIDELMSNAPQAEVVLLLKEKKPGLISGSLRAPGKLADVSIIAGKLGGGGHKKAAGFRIKEKSMDQALEMATQTIKEYMDDKLRTENSPIDEQRGRLFPSLTSKPNQSIPAPSPGGEDMLLEQFRQQQNPKEEQIKERATRFFQDADGQEKTVGEVLSDLGEDGVV